MPDNGYIVSADGDGYTIDLGTARQFVAQTGPLNAWAASTTDSLGSSLLSSTAFGGIGASVGSASELLHNGLIDGLTKAISVSASTTDDVHSVIESYVAADDDVTKLYQGLAAQRRQHKMPAVQQPQLNLDQRVVDSIMKAEGANGEQGGVLEVYGFRQSMNNGYDEIMAARKQYGKGSPQEVAVVKSLLEKHAVSAGALQFSDPGEQAAIASLAHMRGVGGARAILNSASTWHVEESAKLDPDAVKDLQQLSPSDFQQQLRDARLNYDQTIYGWQKTTVKGKVHNWWAYYGSGLTDRYDKEQQLFQSISDGN